MSNDVLVIYEMKLQNVIFNGKGTLLLTSRGQFFNLNPINRVNFEYRYNTFMIYTNYEMNIRTNIYIYKTI